MKWFENRFLEASEAPERCVRGIQFPDISAKEKGFKIDLPVRRFRFASDRCGKLPLYCFHSVKERLQIAWEVANVVKEEEGGGGGGE